MTDDKGAGEGPYIHTLAAYYLPCEANCPACAYEAGRKAERERCAKIAESHVTKFNGFQIADAIRGGQDAK